MIITDNSSRDTELKKYTNTCNSFSLFCICGQLHLWLIVLSLIVAFKHAQWRCLSLLFCPHPHPKSSALLSATPRQQAGRSSARLLHTRLPVPLLSCTHNAKGRLSHMRSRTRPSCLIVLSASLLELLGLFVLLSVSAMWIICTASLQHPPPASAPGLPRLNSLSLLEQMSCFLPLIAPSSCILLLLVRFPKCHSLLNVA